MCARLVLDSLLSDLLQLFLILVKCTLYWHFSILFGHFMHSLTRMVGSWELLGLREHIYLNGVLKFDEVKAMIWLNELIYQNVSQNFICICVVFVLHAIKRSSIVNLLYVNQQTC